ncbi:hypothetical protein N326_08916, partial [Eurypyga helias]
KEPTAHQLRRDSTLECCLPTPSFPGGLPGLDQPFPYYRTEGKLCTSPATGDRFFTRIEGLESKEGGQGGQTGIWTFNASCVV